MRHPVLSLAVVAVALLGLACQTARPENWPPARGADAEAEAEIETAGTEADEDTEAASDDAATQAQARKPSALRRHAESAAEGAIIGTVVGGQIGGVYGAAAGAALFGLYGLITGDVPFDAGRPARGPAGPVGSADDAMEREIDDELDRQDALENEIEQELRRQEELLTAINRQEEINDSIRQEQAERTEGEFDYDPLSAPAPPYERRDIPDSLYEKSQDTEGRREVVVKTLDADRDGNPEIKLVYDERSGELLRRSEDTDYDGSLDAHNTYEDGQIAERSEDTNGDGKPDRWTRYENGRGISVEVDRDFDGKRDGNYAYADGWLSMEEHDTNGDGRIDRRVQFRGRQRALELEDSNGDGEMDVWIYYDAREIPTRIEKDTNGDGNPDVWEHYGGNAPGKMILVRKDQDLTGDGVVDVKSHYKKGKLNRKEVLNPSALN